MKKPKQTQILSDTTIQTKPNDQNHDVKLIFQPFKQDFQHVNPLSINQNINFLSPTPRSQRKASTYSVKQKKAMKLIDYIYIRNTVRKNQQFKKSSKQMSENELKKSRMQQGKQKAFKTIVTQMVKEFKQLSIKASAISELVQENVVYTGSIDQLAKMCNARRILQQKIFDSLQQIQKTIGIGSHQLQRKQQKIVSLKQENQMQSQMRRLEDMGVKRLKSEPDIDDQIKINLVKVKKSNRLYTEE